MSIPLGAQWQIIEKYDALKVKQTLHGECMVCFVATHKNFGTSLQCIPALNNKNHILVEI